MTQPILAFVFLLCYHSAEAAQKDDFWYKVESKKEVKNQKENPSYPYDSIEVTEEKKVFREIGFWPNSSNISFGGGFFADEEYFKNDKTDASKNKDGRN